ncbi:MAG: ABC transporter permease, partial [Gammaproteobacteria bacterium]
YTGVSAIPLTLVTAALIGLVMVLQALYWLQLFGQIGIIGQFLVLVLVREIAPLVTGLILVGRSGTASVVELLNLRLHGQLHTLDAQGVDPFTFLLVPRVAAFAACMFALNMFFVVTALLAGNVAANAVGMANLGLRDFIDAVLRAMGPTEYLLMALKPLTIGFVVGIITIVTPLGSSRGKANVYRALPVGFMRGVLAVLAVSGAITVLFR